MNMHARWIVSGHLRQRSTNVGFFILFYLYDSDDDDDFRTGLMDPLKLNKKSIPTLISSKKSTSTSSESKKRSSPRSRSDDGDTSEDLPIDVGTFEAVALTPAAPKQVGIQS